MKPLAPGTDSILCAAVTDAARTAIWKNCGTRVVTCRFTMSTRTARLTYYGIYAGGRAESRSTALLGRDQGCRVRGDQRQWYHHPPLLRSVATTALGMTGDPQPARRPLRGGPKRLDRPGSSTRGCCSVAEPNHNSSARLAQLDQAPVRGSPAARVRVESPASGPT